MYFTGVGPKNTDQTIEEAFKRAKELNINNIVVASNQGITAEKLIDSGLNIICVTHHVGFSGPGVNEMPADMREKLIKSGIKVLTTTHFFAGADRAVRNKFGGVYPSELMAQTLRIFGQGVKVAVEVATMSLDAGLIPYGEKIISIGGTGRGADSALVLIPEHSNNFFGTKVLEVVCKPGEW